MLLVASFIVYNFLRKVPVTLIFSSLLFFSFRLFSVDKKVSSSCCCCSCLSDPVHNSLLHSSARQHSQHQVPQGKRQSPIHITTADTVTSKDLKPLNFVKGWTEPMSGTLDNLGYTVTFRPKPSSVTTLQTHKREGYTGADPGFEEGGAQWRRTWSARAKC